MTINMYGIVMTSTSKYRKYLFDISTFRVPIKNFQVAVFHVFITALHAQRLFIFRRLNVNLIYESLLILYRPIAH